MITLILFDRSQPEGVDPIPVPLPHDIRKRSRYQFARADGVTWGLLVPRGSALDPGRCLGSADGQAIQIIASPEPLIEVTVSDPVQFATLCYHLGNRHVQLQIGAGVAWFPVDHVLEQLCLHLGGRVHRVLQPFHPELGAYGGHGHD